MNLLEVHLLSVFPKLTTLDLTLSLSIDEATLKSLLAWKQLRFIDISLVIGFPGLLSSETISEIATEARSKGQCTLRTKELILWVDGLFGKDLKRWPDIKNERQLQELQSIRLHDSIPADPIPFLEKCKNLRSLILKEQLSEETTRQINERFPNVSIEYTNEE